MDSIACGKDQQKHPGPADPARLQSLLLRIGLAFVFAYASVACLTNPASFMTYMPSVLPMALVERFCLPAFSAFELALAAGLLSGRRLFALSLVAALTVGTITVANPDRFDILFRNVAITFAALSLAVQARATDLARRAAGPDAPVFPEAFDLDDPGDVTPTRLGVTPAPLDMTPKPLDTTPPPLDMTPKLPDETPTPRDVISLDPRPADLFPPTCFLPQSFPDPAEPSVGSDPTIDAAPSLLAGAPPQTLETAE